MAVTASSIAAAGIQAIQTLFLDDIFACAVITVVDLRPLQCVLSLRPQWQNANALCSSA